MEKSIISLNLTKEEKFEQRLDEIKNQIDYDIQSIISLVEDTKEEIADLIKREPKIIMKNQGLKEVEQIFRGKSTIPGISVKMLTVEQELGALEERFLKAKPEELDCIQQEITQITSRIENVKMDERMEEASSSITGYSHNPYKRPTTPTRDIYIRGYLTLKKNFPMIGERRGITCIPE